MFILMTPSIKNIFNFPLFFIINNNGRWGLINLIGQQICKYFSKQVGMKNIIDLY